MFVGGARQYVVQSLQVQRGEVAVSIERVEVGTQYGVLPNAFAGYADSALPRCGEQGDDVETVL